MQKPSSALASYRRFPQRAKEGVGLRERGRALWLWCPPLFSELRQRHIIYVMSTCRVENVGKLPDVSTMVLWKRFPLRSVSSRSRHSWRHRIADVVKGEIQRASSFNRIVFHMRRPLNSGSLLSHRPARWRYGARRQYCRQSLFCFCTDFGPRSRPGVPRFLPAQNGRRARSEIVDQMSAILPEKTRRPSPRRVEFCSVHCETVATRGDDDCVVSVT